MVKVQRSCQYCQKVFYVHNCRVMRGRGKFCSLDCRYSYKANRLTKKCPCCGEEKARSKFLPKNNTSKFYRFSSWCRSCSAQRARTSPTRKESLKRSYIKNTYGITLEAYLMFLEAPCGICGESSEVLDHDHETKIVRGGLCRNHNVGLGFFNDNPKHLRVAADYLEYKR